MSSLIAIMDELAATLEAATSVAQVTGRFNLNPSPPTIDIYPGTEFRTGDAAAFGDVNGALVFTVRARVAVADNVAGQEVLLALMDDESSECVAAALQDDQTLNGLASSVLVEGPSGFLPYPLPGGGWLLGCEWAVTVLNLIT